MNKFCRYVMSNGEECGAQIREDDRSPSGFEHQRGPGWLHWASDRRYGPQDSKAAFTALESAGEVKPGDQSAEPHQHKP